MMVELLILMVFVVLANTQQVLAEIDQIEACPLALEQCRKENQDLARRIKEERQRSAELQRLLDEAKATIAGLLQENGMLLKAVETCRADHDRCRQERSAWEAKAGENAKVKRGDDFPNCSEVVSGKWLFRMTLHPGSKLRVLSAWADGDDSRVMQVPGVAELMRYRGETISLPVFERHAEQIFAWGKSRPEPCVFRVIAKESVVTIAEEQRRLDSAVQAYFYSK